jgi:STE24 endopeptidase
MLYVVVGIIFFMYLLELTISFLNYQHRHKPIPENVANIYDAEEYKKWLNYTMENTRFGLISKSFNTIILIVLLVFGGFSMFVEWANSLFPSSIMLQTLGFLFIYLVVTTIIGIPFGYYQTFKIEEKYGFNKSNKKTFFLDQIKNLLMIGLLFGGIVSAMHVLFIEFEDRLWLFVIGTWVVLVIFITVMFVLNTKVFVKVFNKLTPLPEGELRDKLEKLAKEVGFEIKAISIMDASKRSTKLNAFFSGLGKTREIVLYDTLLEKLSEDEILSTLAHELGHAVHKDAPRMLLESSFVFGLYAIMFGFILSTPSLYQAFDITLNHFGFGVILFSVLIGPLDFLLGIPLNYLSRRAEYKADAYSASLIDKKHMMSALRVLVKENLSNLNPHPLYELVKYSHPKISDRLQAIEEL